MTRFAFIAFAVAMFSWITVHGVMSGLQGDRIKVLVDEQPHLLWESTPRSLSLETKTKLEALLKNHGLKSIKYVLQTEGLMELVRPDERGRTQGAGIVMRADDSLKPGSVLMGGELAQMTKVYLGDQLKLHSVWNLEGMPLTVEVAGLVHPRDFDAAKQLMWLATSDIESLIEHKDAISRIEISLQDPEKAAALLPEVQKVIPDHWQTWRDLNRSLLMSLALERNMMALTMFFLVILASLALYLSLSVRVVERTRQSALLLALGARLPKVRNVFLFEGLTIGAVGTLVGATAAMFFCWYLKNYFQLPALYYSRRVPVDLSVISIVVLIAVSMGLALVASFFPANQVSKIEIAEALK